MLSFFFNRFSKMVVVMEATGLVLLPLAIYRFATRGSSFGLALFIVAIAIYVFIRICAIKNWYPGAPRFSGIELHFKKVLVATSYVLAIFNLLATIAPSAWLSGIEAVIMTLIAHVNVILIYLHFRDGEETPINYFSSGHP